MRIVRLVKKNSKIPNDVVIIAAIPKIIVEVLPGASGSPPFVVCMTRTGVGVGCITVVGVGCTNVVGVGVGTPTVGIAVGVGVLVGFGASVAEGVAD